MIHYAHSCMHPKVNKNPYNDYLFVVEEQASESLFFSIRNYMQNIFRITTWTGDRTGNKYYMDRNLVCNAIIRSKILLNWIVIFIIFRLLVITLVQKQYSNKRILFNFITQVNNEVYWNLPIKCVIIDPVFYWVTIESLNLWLKEVLLYNLSYQNILLIFSSPLIDNWS